MDPVSDDYLIDRKFCEFTDAATEHAFRQHHLAWSLAQLRITLIICGVFYLTFFVTDIAVLGYSREAFILGCVRLTVALLTFAAVILCQRYPMPLVSSGATATVVEAAGMLAFLIVVAYRPLELPWHGMSYGLMLLVIYIFIPNRSVMAAGVAMISTVLFLLLTLHLNVLPSNEFVMLSMLLILANTFGFLAARRYHRLWRREFQAQRELKKMISQLEVATEEAHRGRELAERLADEKSKFLAAASHDLRQPVQAMSLFGEALTRTELNAEQRQLSEYLNRSAKSMSDILEALLDVSRFDAGSQKVHLEPIAIDELLAQLNQEFSPFAATKRLSFRTGVPRSGMRVLADRQLLTSLLTNLIGNAIKYTEHGGVLAGVRQRKAGVMIQVWDTGPGIQTDALQHIFDEYYQINNPERDPKKGLGLGLSIVRRTANLLKTEVDCRSRVGRGSVFEFVLPLAPLVL